MRREVRRARVHVINELIRKGKQLRARKGTEQQKEKNVKKADRFRELILVIKKLKEDDVSKFALGNTRSLEELISSTTLPLETIGFARLAAHKSMRAIVDAFRSKFTNWEFQLSPLLDEINRRKPMKSVSKKKVTLSEKNKINNCKLKRSVEEESEDGTKERTVLKKKGVFSRDIEKIAMTEEEESEDDNVMKSKIKPVPKKKEDEKFVRMADAEEEDGECCRSVDFKQSYVKDKQTVARKRNSQRDKLNKTVAEVRRFTDILSSEGNFDSVHTDTESESEVDNSVDPFFVTDDGEEGNLDIVASRPAIKQVKHDGLNRKERRFRQFHSNGNHSFNRGKRGSQFQCNDTSGFITKKERVQHNKNKKFDVNAKGNKTQQFQKRMGSFDNSNASKGEEVLHPSWEAKRKMKEQQISAFQGKKIKFEDSD